MRRLKFIPTIVVKYLMRFFYGLFSVLYKVDGKKITFASYRSDKLKDNLYCVYKEMERKYPSYKRNLLFKQFNSSLTGKLNYIIHMIRACYHLATSRYFIIDDYYIPVYLIKPRKNTEVIQLWHSAGALKKFGLSTIGKPYGPSKDYLKHVKIHSNYSKAYVSSEGVRKYFAEAFGMHKDQIYPLGVPRTDYFYSESRSINVREQFFQTYPEIEGKKLLLYAPTFRGKGHYQDIFECPFDMEYMKDALEDDYVLLIHLHPYMQGKLKLSEDLTGFAYHIYEAYTIQELLLLTDILITDYSTVFFDFSLLNRPIIFYPYDLDEYRRERDFYYTYEELIPGPLVMDTESLIALIQKNKFDTSKLTRFRNQFFDHQDGRVTERIVEHIMNN
ncbi:CDP-glycerol glycerophosphotransferase family protein [Virgibacillus oceani]|uniref:CDP-glycerol:glycerophosphate glycerophosphotransferase n=1 Tax=Virgibacillus oceani TaxID=1479511 RepID=A0A917HBM5_9BACI|nr:CDP-glycerol glycerophosphotransferase family protein [Virgibacillus oceani]GGG73360.1 hypothetical protein GCM10011398_17270 [Virgibacillus oceani]